MFGKKSQLSLVMSSLVCFVLVSGSAVADKLLPLAQGRYSASFVLEPGTVPLAPGTQVQFYSKSKTSPPRVYYIKGLVLGVVGRVITFELHEDSALRLAEIRNERDVRFRKIDDPDPLEVEARRNAHTNGQVFIDAPNMRRATVQMTLNEADLAGLVPGEQIRFPDAHHVDRYRKMNGAKEQYTHTSDIVAIFVSAKSANGSMYDVTVVVDPFNAANLERANLQGRVSLHREKAQSASIMVQKEICYAITRRGTEINRLTIPCS